MTVLLIASSPTLPSRSTALLEAAGERLSRRGARIERLAIRDLPAQALLLAEWTHPAIERAIDQVARARVVVVATPVYKAAYSGVLKVFLDLLSQSALKGKTVLPLATGGSQSHMLALDYALRPVLASMSARFILPSIYATSDQLGRSAEGGLTLAAPIAVRVAQGVEQLVSELRLVAPRPATEAVAAKDLHAVPA